MFPIVRSKLIQMIAFLLAGFTVLLAPAPSPASSPVVNAADSSGGPSPFPVTIEHEYGATTITKAPERVVLVGLTEQDAFLALGVAPVMTREWFGMRPGAIFPWAEKALGDAPVPEVLSASELDYERIAAMRPDVIVGLYAGLTREEYDTLSRIAPTVAQPGEYVDWGIPWHELTMTVGRILGQESRAEELVAAVEARFAAARRNHPEFRGATAVLASTWGEGSFWVYGPEDPRVRFLENLGFTSPSDIAARVKDGGEFGVSISDERIDLIDADVVIWFVASEDEAEALKADPLYRRLDVAREGRHLFLWDGVIYDAYNFNTVLSLPFALDALVPMLAAAIDGDPSTEANR